MQDATLVLRDIHQPAAPSWWPPAPGWWVLVLVLLVLVAVFVFWRRHRKQRQRRILALFDDTVAAADGAASQVAAISELLRRAARRHQPDADTLQGEAWLVLLDAGDPHRPFTQGAGRLLLEGAYRRDVDPHDVAALRDIARMRFIGWMHQ